MVIIRLKTKDSLWSFKVRVVADECPTFDCFNIEFDNRGRARCQTRKREGCPEVKVHKGQYRKINNRWSTDPRWEMINNILKS